VAIEAMSTYVRRRYRVSKPGWAVDPGIDDLELYGEVELHRGPAGAWWYGRWYSWVMPAGVTGGVAVECPEVEQIGHAEFEMARAQRWALGPDVDVDDDEVASGSWTHARNLIDGR
jgi:hypothetical protein